MINYEPTTVYQQIFNPFYSVDGGLVAASENHWSLPPKWNRAAKHKRNIKRVLCSYSIDLFQKRNDCLFDEQTLFALWKNGEIGSWRASEKRILRRDLPVTIDDARCRMFQIIQSCKNIKWLLKTDYPENVIRMIPKTWKESFPKNVWVGTSIRTQNDADNRIPHLLKVPTVVRFLWCEQLLEDIEWSFSTGDCFRCRSSRLQGDDKRRWFCANCNADQPHIEWVIVNGECGPQAQSLNLEYVRELRRECKCAKIHFFVNRLGSNLCVDPKGVNPAQWPEDLRVQEVPV